MRGLLAYLDVIRDLGRLKLLKYFVISGLISAFIGVAVFGLSYSFADDIGGWIQELYPWEFGSGLIDRISDWTSGISIFLIGLLSLKYILLIVLSPILSLMSESIERKLNANYTPVKFSISSLISDLIRGLMINLRSLLKELLIIAVLLVISFFPGAAIVTTPLIFVVQAYYAGFGLLDYWMERRYSISESVQYVRNHRLNAIGLGVVYLAMLMIPIIGYAIGPVLGAAAATIYAVDRQDYIV